MVSLLHLLSMDNCGVKIMSMLIIQDQKQTALGTSNSFK